MRAQNRHDTAKWKAKRKNHGADRCGKAKCSICHPHKHIGGNWRSSIKAKYYIKNEVFCTNEVE